MPRFSPFKIIRARRMRSFWNMNDKEQREFVRQILEEFAIEVNRRAEEKKSES